MSNLTLQGIVIALSSKYLVTKRRNSVLYISTLIKLNLSCFIFNQLRLSLSAVFSSDWNKNTFIKDICVNKNMCVLAHYCSAFNWKYTHPFYHRDIQNYICNHLVILLQLHPFILSAAVCYRSIVAFSKSFHCNSCSQLLHCLYWWIHISEEQPVDGPTLFISI